MTKQDQALEKACAVQWLVLLHIISTGYQEIAFQNNKVCSAAHSRLRGCTFGGAALWPEYEKTYTETSHAIVYPYDYWGVATLSSVLRLSTVN